MRKIAIYLGPSLDVADARAVLDAEYLAPIKRNDLAKLSEEITTVGIIDGEFFQSLAVSPMEVVTLLDRSVKVYGASSMGALRAVETEPYGMIGVGKIFEWFRDGLIDADDEVALAYDPQTYRHCSVPLVNIRFALNDAVCSGVISEGKAQEIIDAVKKVYFPLRSLALVYELCPVLRSFFAMRKPDQKRDDALALLHTIASDVVNN
jgi:hypothetical protein